MKAQLSCFLLTILIFWNPSAGAQDSTDVCEGLDLSANAVVAELKITTEGLKRFCDRYRDLHRRMEKAEADLVRLQQLVVGQSEVNNAIRSELPPQGSILIVDNPLACPEGWHDVASREPKIFAGRSIIAVGSDGERDTRIYRDKGGEEQVTLTVAQMPSHNHSMGVTIRGDGTGAGYPYTRPAGGPGDKTYHAGGSEPHNNMPPYIALYFCKKGD